MTDERYWPSSFAVAAFRAVAIFTISNENIYHLNEFLCKLSNFGRSYIWQVTYRPTSAEHHFKIRSQLADARIRIFVVISVLFYSVTVTWTSPVLNLSASLWSWGIYIYVYNTVCRRASIYRRLQSVAAAGMRSNNLPGVKNSKNDPLGPKPFSNQIDACD